MTFNPVLNSILPSFIPKLAPIFLIALLIPRMLSGLHPFFKRSLLRATLNSRLNLYGIHPRAGQGEIEISLYWVHKYLGDREAGLAG
jgi:hypothetical protein